MTDQSMVEKVGWAICKVEDAGYCECAMKGSGLCSDVRDIARAAIEAMREPTEAMWEGWRSVNCESGTNGFEEFTYFEGDYGNWLACHQAMIDEALKL